MEATFSQRDEFKRKIVAENLIKLFDSEDNITPVVIDGPWGSGKTEFCHKFVNLCIEKKVGFQCVYIDAFKYDHSEEPLLMLIAAVASLVKDESKKKDLVKKAIPIAKVLGKTAGKAAIAWVLKANAEDLGEELSEALKVGGEEAVDDGIKKVFENFEKAEENLKIFKDALETITKENKIVIAIDELDRCRPLFALALLEKIKHVFDVKGVSILLSTNVRQIQAIVKKQYGSEIDAETYLSKFFSLVIHLPQDHELGNREYAQNAQRLFYDLVNANTILSRFYSPDSTICHLFKDIFELHGRSLRDAEKFFRNIEVFNKFGGDFTIKENTLWAYVAFIFMGIYIYTFDPNLATKIARGQHSLQDISRFLGVEMNALKEVDDRDFRVLLLAAFVLDTNDETHWSKFGEGAAKNWNTQISKCFNQGREPGRGNRIGIFQRTIRKLQFI